MTFKEFALQDANTLQATQLGIESEYVDTYHLNDQEILCRHLHHEVAKWIERLRVDARGGEVMAMLPAKRLPISNPSQPTWCLATEPERQAQTVLQLDGRDAGVLRRHRAPRRGGDLPSRHVRARRAG